MNTIQKNMLLGLILLLLFSSVMMTHARSRYNRRGSIPAYVEITAGAGAAFMPFDSNEDYSTLSGGMVDLDVRYSMLFGRRTGWGASAGLGFASFLGSRVMRGTYFNTDAYDDDLYNESYDLKSEFREWNETQDLYYVKVPLTLFYQTNDKYSTSATNIYFSGGFNFYIPLSGKYDVASGEVVNSAFYLGHGGRISHGSFNENAANQSELGMILYNLPQHGFGTENTYLPSGDVDASFFASFRLEFGVRFPLSSARYTNEVFISAYLETGLNDMIQTTDGKSLFSSPTTYNGLYGSGLSSSTMPVMFGLHIGYRFTDIFDCHCIGH